MTKDIIVYKDVEMNKDNNNYFHKSKLTSISNKRQVYCKNRMVKGVE